MSVKPKSIEGVITVHRIEGQLADSESIPLLIIELPHGATRTEHYMNMAKEIKGDLVQDLIHFFYVNTDVASPELAFALAELVVQSFPKHVVLILQSLIPRTLIDCNRILTDDQSLYKKGKVTPGIPTYIRNSADKKWLIERHQLYQNEVSKGIDYCCGNGGRALFLHTYAPKSVGIEQVDDDIVNQLHWAYSPEVYERWPFRPQVDFITQPPNDEILCDTKWHSASDLFLKTANFIPGTGESYPLHPVTTAYHHSKKYPGQTLCLEFRRDLLVKDFTPFEEMKACPEKIRRAAIPLRDALISLF